MGSEVENQFSKILIRSEQPWKGNIQHISYPCNGFHIRPMNTFLVAIETGACNRRLYSRSNPHSSLRNV
ncbi:hypothetical protein IN34_00825 [Salmonella enterica]|nr:hypothetical protein FORC38_4113 [Salmonella enterica]AZH76309.1 Hypothetical protein FORC80_3952 [Salmonella enterica subsp. enterica serovar Virchow]KTM79598.1 hypothetical protein IN34_00825 [Salmonella enterica]KYN92840.1 hypothetical protein A3219_14960 [Salmonella enterica]